jgi:acid phosphatase
MRPIGANVNYRDLLDTKGISWAEYQEGLPYAGFQGFNYSNQKTFANNYVRKHNPLVIYDSIANNATRLANIKNFTSWDSDLAAQKLPQWSFITPNMTNDAHDTNVTFAASWARGFLEPLLNNSYFMNDTLVILTFDEDETYTVPNRIQAILLGGAIPSNLKGTVDSLYYNHYSTISTVSVNWGLPSLGRWDCDANVLAFVANKTGYKNSNISLDGLYFNTSYPGPLSDKAYTAGWWPTPDTQAKCAAGLGVLPSIVSTWGNSTGSYNYTNVYPYDAASGSNVKGTPTVGSADSSGSSSGTGSSSSSSASGSAGGSSSGGSSTTSGAPAATSSGAAGNVHAEAMAVLGVAGLVAAFL